MSILCLWKESEYEEAELGYAIVAEALLKSAEEYCKWRKNYLARLIFYNSVRPLFDMLRLDMMSDERRRRWVKGGVNNERS